MYIHSHLTPVRDNANFSAHTDTLRLVYVFWCMYVANTVLFSRTKWKRTLTEQARGTYVWMFVLFKDIFPKLFHPTMLCNWRLWLCRKRALAVLEIPRKKKNVVILGGIRTRDLWIRSPARYPLRYEDITLLHIIWLLILHLSSLLHGLFPLSLAFILSKLLLVEIESENYWKT